MLPTPRRRHKPSENSRPLDREALHLVIACEAIDGLACLHVTASMSLAALHQEIASRTGYDVEVPYQFEIPTSPGGLTKFGPGASDPETLLGGFGFEPGSAFRYTAELPRGPFELSITVLDIYEAEPGASFPKEEVWSLFHHARPVFDAQEEDEVPPMVPLDPDLEPLERMIIDAFEAHHFEADEESEHPDFDGHLALALRMMELVEPRPLQFEALCDAVGEELDGWVWSLMDGLLDRQRFHEFMAALDRMSKLPEVFPELRSSRFLGYVGLKQRDDALALFDEMVSEMDAQAHLKLHVARSLDGLVELGELTRAEAMANQLRGEKDSEIQFCVLEALADVYKRTGRKREARRIERESDKIAIRMLQEEERSRATLTFDDGSLVFEPEPAPADPVRRDGPKVGRNDPCPCGSGKKYKKCCGA